jgi:hypothetical protein
MVNFFAIVLGLFTLVIAGLVGRFGRRQHRRQSLVTGTETTAVRDIDEEGLVELKGRVRSEDTFESPIRGTDSAVAAWEIEEWDERGSSEMWETLASGVYATPFTLDDGTGEVRVEVGDHVVGESHQQTEISLGPVDLDRFLSAGVSVDDVFCSFERFAAETTVPPDADPPERIAAFIAGEDDISEATDSITNVVDVGNAHGERRYYEGGVAPGEEVYLLGEAQAGDDATYPLGPDDVVVRPPEGEGSLILSDREEDALVEELGGYRIAYGIAAALGLVAAGSFVIGAGVVDLAAVGL